MSKFSDLLRQAADISDGLEASSKFIKDDMKRNIIRYINDVKANAALKEYSDKLKDVSFENMDGARLLKEEHGRGSSYKTYFGSGAQPWWAESVSRYPGRSAG